MGIWHRPGVKSDQPVKMSGVCLHSLKLNSPQRVARVGLSDSMNLGKLNLDGQKDKVI